MNRFKDSPEIISQINHTSMSDILNRTGIIHHDVGSAFQGEATQGSLIQVTGRGQTGDEIMVLQVDGKDVKAWQVTTEFANYTYRSDETLTADRIRIVFRNDVYDQANNYDRNLIVDKLDIDGCITETESRHVFSTGTWTSSDGVVPGFRMSESLHANGFLQFGFSTLDGVVKFDGDGEPKI